MNTFTFAQIPPCFSTRAVMRWQGSDILNNPHNWGYIYKDGRCNCMVNEMRGDCEHIQAYRQLVDEAMIAEQFEELMDERYRFDFESLDGRHQETAVTDEPDEYALSLAREWRLTDADEVVYAVAV